LLELPHVKYLQVVEGLGLAKATNLQTGSAKEWAQVAMAQALVEVTTFELEEGSGNKVLLITLLALH
jgi:hypothetical protein